MNLNRSCFVGFALTLLLGAGCSHGDATGKQEAGLAEVTVAKPVVEKVTGYEYFTGRIVAIPVVEVRARVDGYLEKTFFKDGQEVQKNDKLFEIDRRPYQAEVDRLKASVERSAAAVKTTKAELARQEQLLAQRATARADFDKAAGLSGEAVGAQKGAEASLEKANLDLGFTTIVAAITGRASNTNIDPGNIVIADKTLLTTLVAVDPIYVEFNVDERTVLEVQESIRAKKVKSTAEAEMPAWVSLANDGGQFPYEGKIDFIDNRVNTSTGTLKVRAKLENLLKDGQRRFTPGLFVRVKVPITEARPEFLVVDRAIDSDLDQKFVYVVDGQKKVERRPVKLGPLHNGLRVVEPVPVVETKQGPRPARGNEKGVPSLNEGDWIVINGLQFITTGVSVKTMETKMANGGNSE